MENGTKVIIRSSPSGCWYGELAARDGATVTLRNARRLWRWWAAEGVSLSGVAAAGLHPLRTKECQIAAAVETAVVFEVCEILATTEAAQASIEAAPVLAQ
jgi:hypothetical protein